MQTAIKVEQLSKSYGNLLAADQISLSVNTAPFTGCLAQMAQGKVQRLNVS